MLQLLYAAAGDRRVHCGKQDHLLQRTLLSNKHTARPICRR